MARCSSVRRHRALIVEDELMIALDLEDAMSALGFDICSLASTADTARSIAMDHQPDVVLMDVNLDGGHEGIEAGRWLREVCDVPVVFVTGYSDEGTIERIREQVPGAPVLAKPVCPQTLADAVGALV
jgi:DNA-binding response OmpR family regulator